MPALYAHAVGAWPLRSSCAPGNPYYVAYATPGRMSLVWKDCTQQKQRIIDIIEINDMIDITNMVDIIEMIEY